MDLGRKELTEVQDLIWRVVEGIEASAILTSTLPLQVFGP